MIEIVQAWAYQSTLQLSQKNNSIETTSEASTILVNLIQVLTENMAFLPVQTIVETVLCLRCTKQQKDQYLDIFIVDHQYEPLI